MTQTTPRRRAFFSADYMLEFFKANEITVLQHNQAPGTNHYLYQVSPRLTVMVDQDQDELWILVTEENNPEEVLTEWDFEGNMHHCYFQLRDLMAKEAAGQL